MIPKKRRQTWKEEGLEMKVEILAIGNTLEVGEDPGDQRVRDMVVRRTKPTAAAGVGLERGWETAAKTILPQQHVHLDQ